MVFFICNHCGESMKKQVVSNHAYRCRGQINVSCMDCNKDFYGQAYVAHTTCISEEQKYAAKGFVVKEKKGVKKQESWISLVRSIPERNNNLSPGVKSVFKIIVQKDNIPRKCKAFVNFFNNSHKYISTKDVEEAWALIEREVKSENQTPAGQNGVKTEPSVPTLNGTSDPVKNGEPQQAVAEKESAATRQKKRKTEDALENDHEQVEPSQTTKQKKRKTKDTSVNGHEDEAALLANETNGADATETEQQQEQNGEQEKFQWSEVIRELLLAKNNQMKLSKLKKKVMKRYQQTTGSSQTGEKFEKKFQKKIAKNGFVVENDTVRLVEAA
uniref:Uncharacterized protein n=1 Tax=Anopheles maculatus TaxID=74869 RepID=A0A182T8N4_9DIPT